MNIEYLEKFTSEIEEFAKATNNSTIEMIILSAKNIIQHGEYEIALDTILDNLYKESIFLDQKIINLACKSYDKTITLEKKIVLSILTKQERGPDKNVGVGQ